MKKTIIAAILSGVIFCLEAGSFFSVGEIINKYFPCEQELMNSFPCYGIYDIVFMFTLAGIFATSLILIVYKYIKKKTGEIKEVKLNFGEDRVPVPVLASFGGLKFLPSPFAVAYNNFNPLLIFLRDGMEYRLFFKKYKKYSDIELVDVTILPGTRNLKFVFRDSVVTFSANLYDDNNLKSALRFLGEKNCILSSRAKEFLIK